MRWEDVVASGMRFPAVSESTAYGTPCLRVGKKFMCRWRTNPDGLMIGVSDLQEKEALLEGQPDVFFTTPHYDGYAAVLVHLDRVRPETLDELVEDAWRMCALKKHLKALAERSEASS